MAVQIKTLPPVPILEQEEDIYPETDGKPMAESDLHYKQIEELRAVLDEFFSNNPNIYVSGNILIYYEKGNQKKISPQMFL